MHIPNPFIKGSEENWISFYGSFAGGIITLIALFLTLEHNEEIQKNTRHDSGRLYIKAWHLNGAVNCDELLNKVPIYDFIYSPNEKMLEKK